MKIKFQIVAIATVLMALTASPIFAQAQQRSTAARTIVQDSNVVPSSSTRSIRSINKGRSTDAFLIQDAQPGQAYSVISDPPAVPVPAQQLQAPAPAMGYPMGDATIDAYACDCQQPSCRKCRLRGRLAAGRMAAGCNSCGTDCGCVQCPKCEGDICKLELDKSKQTKTCFKTEQVPVCIPPVRMPWQDCCPPGTSKTRLVTKLKVHKYECPGCSYKWTLQKPEKATAAAQPEMAPNPTPRAAEPRQPEGEVPAAPTLKGAFRNWSRSRR